MTLKCFDRLSPRAVVLNLSWSLHPLSETEKTSQRPRFKITQLLLFYVKIYSEEQKQKGFCLIHMSTLLQFYYILCKIKMKSKKR